MTRLCNCPKSLASKLELNSRKNQLIEESCKTCGGRFLVDGIGPIATRMLSTVGLEVTNSINPELNWKSVTKGRRSRKPVARNVNGVAKLGYRSPKRVGDFLVSDSDKFDESTTGRQAPDKVESIPLKKRRHLLRSPSPPPQPSSVHNEELLSPQPQTPSPHADNWRSDSIKQQLKGFGGYAAVKPGDRVDDDSISEVTDRKLYNPDDFSGIALLAAAACIDGMDDETTNVKKDLGMRELSVLEKSHACTSPNHIRCTTCVESENPVQKDVVKEEYTKCSPVENSVAVSRSPHEDDGGTMRSLVASRVARLHWDLNIMMDAWEQPFDDPVEGASSKDVTDHIVKGEKLETEGYETSRNSEDNQCDTENHMSLDQTEQNKLALVRGPDRECKEIGMMSLDEHPAKSINDLSTDAENSNQVVSKISSNLNSPWPESHHVSCVSVDEDVMRTASRSISIIQEGAKKFREIMSSETVKVGLENIGLPEVLASECSARENCISSGVAEVSGKTSELPDNSGSNPYEAGRSHSSSKCEDLSASGASTHTVVCSPKGQHDRVSAADATVTESLDHVVPTILASDYDDHDACNEGEKISSIMPDSSKKDDGAQSDDPTNCSAKIGSTLEDCHNSDVLQDERSNIVGSKDMTELQAGYDSPYEDGELRVSMSCPWDENEIEDGENECVDYESDGREVVDSDGADYPGSEVGEAGSEGSQGIEKRSLLVREVSVSDFNKSGSLKSSLRINYMKEDIEKIETGGNKSTSGSGATSEQFERNDDSVRRRHSPDHMDVVDTKGSHVEESNSRATRGKMQSLIEGPSSLDVTERKDTGFLQRSRSRIHSRPVRDISPEKLMGRHRSTFHVREENGGNEQWGYWDSRNRFPSTYHGPDGHSYTRPRSIIAENADKFGGFNSQDHRQSLNYSSKGAHRILGRRSPYERDDYYSVHRRMPAARDISTNRSRGGSGNYAQGFGRGFREEYHDPLPENRTLPSGRMPRYLSRRERSFSPSSGRVPQNSLPRRKSRSRSRTRSPNAWHSQRERNQGLRRHSRSPDFRPEARLERVRMPLQKPNFPADYSRSIVSPPRGRFSPQRNCRWVDDNDYVDNNPRHRRSPVRTFRRGQRFDSVGSSGRLKSDEYFRPTIRPGRFPPFAGTGRGCKFEDNYDDRRRDDRVEIIHRTRHTDAGVNVGRFRHDAEDNFDANNSHKEDDVRSTDRRNVPRSSPEDKKSFKV